MKKAPRPGTSCPANGGTMEEQQEKFTYTVSYTCTRIDGTHYTMIGTTIDEIKIEKQGKTIKPDKNYDDGALRIERTVKRRDRGSKTIFEMTITDPGLFPIAIHGYTTENDKRFTDRLTMEDGQVREQRTFDSIPSRFF